MNDYIDSSCLLTISAFSSNVSLPHQLFDPIDVHVCSIGNFYWVAGMTYERSVLEHDRELSWPFIVRTNVEREGYLSFLLPLLQNSTYSLIVDSQQLQHAMPSIDWIDKAVMEIRNNPFSIPVCGLHKDSFVARGCMLIRSTDLRKAWTRTTIRRTQTPAMVVFSHLFHCMFNYSFVDSIMPQPKAKKEQYKLNSVIATKCKESGIQFFECFAGYHNDGSIGVILPQFKRMWLDQQLEALSASSEIIVLQDAQHQDYQSILRKWKRVRHIWTTNWDSPFFLRFLVTLELTTYYIHNIDDDIVFGNTTLQTLNRMIDTGNTTVGVMGRRVIRSDYLEGHYSQIGVRGKDESSTFGDFLCNSYGGTMETMKVFWRYRPYTQNNGEDIHFSLSNLLECGRRVRILPYDRQSDHFTDHGSDKVATCNTRNHYPLRGKIIRSWLIKGVKFWKGNITNESYPESIAEFYKNYVRDGYYES